MHDSDNGVLQPAHPEHITLVKYILIVVISTRAQAESPTDSLARARKEIKVG